LHRLAEVTQVFGPNEAEVFHNRLTHSLKVAQVARRLAEKLGSEQSAVAEGLGGVDPDVTEAAALAHDIGHPPFGHLAEEELDVLLTQRDSSTVSRGTLNRFEWSPS
jgi:dGTPase